MVAKRKIVKRKPITKRKVIRRKPVKTRKTKGSWDFLEAVTGKNKYERARAKLIKSTEKRQRKEKNPLKALRMTEAVNDFRRMDREYSRREKGEPKSNW
jgi:hypothetical protein